jgi:hypothetical protein
MKKIVTEDGIRYENLTQPQYALAIATASGLGCGIEYGEYRGANRNYNVTLFNENRTDAMVAEFEEALA